MSRRVRDAKVANASGLGSGLSRKCPRNVSAGSLLPIFQADPPAQGLGLVTLMRLKVSGSSVPSLLAN